MRPREPGAPRAGSAETFLPRFLLRLPAAVVQFVSKTLVIAEVEARKLRHDPTELITRALQANHDYRTGTHRLPYTVHVWNSTFGSNPGVLDGLAPLAMQIWPDAAYTLPGTLMPFLYFWGILHVYPSILSRGTFSPALLIFQPGK